MLRLSVRYARYALSMLAGVGFSQGVNSRSRERRSGCQGGHPDHARGRAIR